MTGRRWTRCVALTMAATAAIGGLDLPGARAITSITPTGTITEYTPTGPAATYIEAVAAGPDGAMWFTDLLGDGIGKVAPNGSVKLYRAGITAGAHPIDIVAGPDGAMWFTENDGNRIGRITTAGVVKEYSVGMVPSSFPGRIVVGPDGAMWFTEASGRIGRITTAGKITQHPTAGGGGAIDIVVGPDRALWYTEAGTYIGRMTMNGEASDIVVRNLRFPRDIELGPDGALWYTESTGSWIVRMTTNLDVTEYFNAPAGAVSGGLSAGPDGSLWFTKQGSKKIGRITMTGNISEWTLPVASTMLPTRIAPGPDGAMWFGGGGHAVGRITTGLPGAPLSVHGTAHKGSITVAWTAPTDSGKDPISSSQVTASPGGRTCTTFSHSCTVTGLNPTTVYTFKVSAQNGTGFGPSSKASPRIHPWVLAGAPRTVAITFPAATTAKVTWVAPLSNGGAPIASYQVRWSSNGGSTWGPWTSTGRNRYVVKAGLTKGHAYKVQVRARTAAGNGAIASKAFTQTI